MSTVETQSTLHVRWMLPRDYEHAETIERFSVRPWSYRRLREIARDRNKIGVVAEASEQVVGFMIYGLHRGCLTIERMGVDPEFRRMGVGSELIGRLRNKLEPERRTRIITHVNDDVLDVHLFLQSQGFRATCDGDKYRFEYSI